MLPNIVSMIGPAGFLKSLCLSRNLEEADCKIHYLTSKCGVQGFGWVLPPPIVGAVPKVLGLRFGSFSQAEDRMIGKGMCFFIYIVRCLVRHVHRISRAGFHPNPLHGHNLG